jgi:ATP-binding cassette subfamily B protein AbcA/BmrA
LTLALTASLVSILTYGGIRVANGTLSAGTLTAFLIYIFTVVAPLAQLASFFSQLHAARGASIKMAQVLRLSSEAEADPAATQPPAPLLRSGEPRSLSFVGVRFTYGSSKRSVLEIDYLKLDRGSRTALIGPSGSGKSTLLALIERFYAPQAGAILYGDQNIADFELTDWRSRIGYVPQSTSIMAGTLRDNILYGVRHAVSEAELAKATRLAHCDEFIARLTDGVDTWVGEQGVLLSGGQRQRVAIARMFLRNPEILLLDEATSHLDEESAFLIASSLEALMVGRTSILVTHRLSTVQSMDNIILIDEGRVVDEGDHHSLMLSSKPYRRAVKREFELEST